MSKTIEALLQERILILDGAMGTMIQAYGLTEADYRGERFASTAQLQKGNNDLLTLTRPDIIEEIHRAYLEAGADIIETNTFNSTSVSMADYDMQEVVYEVNLQAAQLARRVADSYTALTPDKPRFVAGAIGPTNKTASMSPEVDNPMYRAVTFDDLRQAYAQQIEALTLGGVDVLLIETIFDTLNAKAAVFAAAEVAERTGRQLPIMLSVTVSDRAGRTLSGQTLGAFVASMAHAPILSIGLNCSFGASDMKPYVRELGRLAPHYISAYPNAGLPNALGQYDETPEKMAQQLQEYIDEGLVNILGGCCGTTPEHIARYVELTKGARPHAVAPRSPYMRLSGLEMLEATPQINFINVGERCNVAGSRKFLRLIKEEKYEEALDLARAQVEAGAQVIDINMDDGLLEGEREMTRFVNLLSTDPDVCRVPLMIDSSKWSVIEAGLKCTQGKAIVNSISLKNGEAEFLREAKLVQRYGAAVIIMAFDERGQADTFQRRIEICQRAYQLLVASGFPQEDIIFDPNVLAIATGIEEHRRYAVDFIETVRWIKANLPGAKISGGVSNLSFSFRGNDYIREAMHAVFLYYAIAEGMDMGIVNPAQSVLYSEIEPELRTLIEDVIFDRREDATERLMDAARALQDGGASAGQATQSKSEEWRSAPLEERLAHALVKGIPDYLEADLSEAIACYPRALDIIDQPLMEGMNRVGDLFGSGKMFLPQVVKAARTMKRAVSILEPVLEAEKSNKGQASHAGKVLLATVKGDVHDIGKNIVGVILACNNYEVVDLGVMVPAEQIIEAIQRERPDVVGLSGLITPSLEEMSIVAGEMERAGISIPLLIGGATTSKLHTALKIEPMYRGGGVVYTRDASQLPAVVAALLGGDSRQGFLSQVRDEYAQLRATAETKVHKPLLSLTQARQLPLRIDWQAEPPHRPAQLGRTVLEAIDLREIVPIINWKFYFHAWNLSAKFYTITEVDACDGCRSAWLSGFPEGERDKAREVIALWDDTRALLAQMLQSGVSHLRAVFELAEAHSVGDTLYIGGTPYPMLRVQEQGESGISLCCADFVAPLEAGLPDWAGTFAVTAGSDVEWLTALGLPTDDDYQTMLIKSILDRLAEATAEWLHARVRREYWGYDATEALSPKQMHDQQYRGIRPAVGYPSIPDQSMNFPLHERLRAGELGISLTENGLMYPNASVSGFYFAHQQSRYFLLGRIDDEQVADYAQRRGTTPECMNKFLAANR